MQKRKSIAVHQESDKAKNNTYKVYYYIYDFDLDSLSVRIENVNIVANNLR